MVSLAVNPEPIPGDSMAFGAVNMRIKGLSLCELTFLNSG